MNILIWWSDKVKTGPRKPAFEKFAQLMANRLIQGTTRYGPVNPDHNYMTRMIMELKTYKREGNLENLVNIANYAILESIAPENPSFHFDNTRKSVTR